MSGLGGGGGGDTVISNTAPIIGSLRLQTSAFGKAIPWAWGRTRLAANLIWYNDFTPIAHVSTETSGGGSGGKGGGAPTTTQVNTTYTYTAAVLLGLCRGTITDIGKVWIEKDQSSLAALGLSLYFGDSAQTAFPYVTTAHPDQALAYRGLAYVASGAYDLGDSANLPNHNLEVQALAYGGSIVDANVKDVLNDILTAGLGWSSGFVGDLTRLSDYCVANGIFISPAYVDQEPAQGIIDRLMQIANSGCVWSEDKLKVVPFGDSTVTGNSVTFTPDLTPLYDLGEDDFLHDTDEDPIRIQRTTPDDAFNQVTVKFFNRANDYNEETAEAKDQGDIEINGLKAMDPVTLHEICDATVAQRVADLLLRRVLYAERNLYQFRLPWKYSLLEPTDLVTLTDADLGLNRLPVRFWTIEENEEAGFDCEAKEFPVGALSSALYAGQQGLGYNADFNASPGNVNPPAFIEAPAVLTSNGLEIWLAASGASALWGGCDVWVSEDNATYQKIGSVYGKARHGVLSAVLAAGLDPDLINTCSVDLTQSGAAMVSGTQADADGLNTLCWVDGEFVAYETATLTAASKYDLTYLRRGQYNSAAVSHLAGTQFVRVDQAVRQARYPFPSSKVGNPIWVKLPSFNIYGGGAQDLADVMPFQYALQGSALLGDLPNVMNVVTSFGAGFTQISWDAIVDFRPVDYEVRFGVTFAGAQVLGRTPLAKFQAIGDGVYWVAAHYRTPDGVDVYSAVPSSISIAGAILVDNVVASYDERALGWPGTLTAYAAQSGADLILTGLNDYLSIVDLLADINILWDGGVASSGAYTIPAAHRVNVGRVVECGVQMNYTLAGVSIFDNVLSLGDLLAVTDFLGAALGVKVGAQPQIRIAQVDGIYGAWQNFIAAEYVGQYFDARILLTSSDPQVYPILSGFKFVVDVPDRQDEFTNVPVGAGGTPFVYATPFNGGPGSALTPNIQVTILSATASDDVILTAESLAGFTVQVKNGGVGVARNLHIISQGY